MLITNHVISGALVGLASPGAVSAFSAGIASHAALDALPHWGGPSIEEVMPIAVADGLTGLAAIAVIARATPSKDRLRVLAGITGACLPDLDKPGNVFFGRSPFPAVIDAWHGRIQREDPRRMPQEIAVAVGLAGALAAVLRRR